MYFQRWHYTVAVSKDCVFYLPKYSPVNHPTMFLWLRLPSQVGLFPASNFFICPNLLLTASQHSFYAAMTPSTRYTRNAKVLIPTQLSTMTHCPWGGRILQTFRLQFKPGKAIKHVTSLNIKHIRPKWQQSVLPEEQSKYRLILQSRREKTKSRVVYIFFNFLKVINVSFIFNSEFIYMHFHKCVKFVFQKYVL